MAVSAQARRRGVAARCGMRGAGSVSGGREGPARIAGQCAWPRARHRVSTLEIRRPYSFGDDFERGGVCYVQVSRLCFCDYYGAVLNKSVSRRVGLRVGYASVISVKFTSTIFKFDITRRI